MLKNKPIFIGIAGGSGVGKSTVCEELRARYPKMIGYIQLDDYFQPVEKVPTMDGIENWDHPDAVDFEKLVQDMHMLAKGASIEVFTKNTRLAPEYGVTGQRAWATIEPKPIMLVEGYLVLHDARVRELFTSSVFLEAPHALRWARRVHFKNDAYEERILVPMHKQYVEPTRAFAKHLVDVSELSAPEMADRVCQYIEADTGLLMRG